MPAALREVARPVQVTAMQHALARLGQREGLSRELARQAMSEVMDGAVSPTLIGAFLLALRVKGESVDEIVGFARAIRAAALPFPAVFADLLDTCGTGGDGARTFNVSTAAAFVAAGAGARVAKHGNRAVSSQTGSADVLEALGITVGMTAAHAAAALDEVGIAFLFAPSFHAAMRHAAPVRRELGMRTVFNLLGPLCNPARAQNQLVGVYDAALVRPLALALRELGTRRALVVHGADGLDELTVTGTSLVAEVQDGEVREYTIAPEDVRLGRYSLDAVRGGDALHNAQLLRGVLSGRASPAMRDIVLLNAGAALLVADRAASLDEGVELARRSIACGDALASLEGLVRFSRSLDA